MRISGTLSTTYLSSPPCARRPRNSLPHTLSLFTFFEPPRHELTVSQFLINNGPFQPHRRWTRNAIRHRRLGRRPCLFTKFIAPKLVAAAAPAATPRESYSCRAYRTRSAAGLGSIWTILGSSGAYYCVERGIQAVVSSRSLPGNSNGSLSHRVTPRSYESP